MFHTVVFVSVIIGVIMVVFSFISIMSARNRSTTDTGDMIDTINAALREFDEANDEALHEINSTAKIILDEMDDKYQALLFLYNLMDDKKKEIDTMANPVNAPKRKTNTPDNTPPAVIRTHPKQAKIIELYNNGLAVAEIAKKLDMGQGEVKLILDLGRRP